MTITGVLVHNETLYLSFVPEILSFLIIPGTSRLKNPHKNLRARWSKQIAQVIYAFLWVAASLTATVHGEVFLRDSATRYETGVGLSTVAFATYL